MREGVVLFHARVKQFGGNEIMAQEWQLSLSQNPIATIENRFTIAKTKFYVNHERNLKQ